VKAAADASAATTPRLAAADAGRCFRHANLLIAPFFICSGTSERPDIWKVPHFFVFLIWYKYHFL
jgi:hypothetical protein